MMRWLDELLGHWEKQKMHVQPGCSVAELDRFEEKLGITLPHEFRLYLERTNGMDPHTSTGTDKQGFWFCSLSELEFYAQSADFVAETPMLALDGKKCLLFADYLHKSWWYGLLFEEQGIEYTVVEIAAENHYRIVASSFSEFVSLYVDEADELYKSYS